VSQDPQIRRTAILANLVGQVGCVTGLVALVIIGVAFGAGWLLDDWMGNERRVVTVILMLGSFPVTLFAMVRISLLMLGRAQDRVAALDQEDLSEETTQT
jgi:F0F1-type ATP synthase assembly protein I